MVASSTPSSTSARRRRTIDAFSSTRLNWLFALSVNHILWGINVSIIHSKKCFFFRHVLIVVPRVRVFLAPDRRQCRHQRVEYRALLLAQRIEPVLYWATLAQYFELIHFLFITAAICCCSCCRCCWRRRRWLVIILGFNFVFIVIPALVNYIFWFIIKASHLPPLHSAILTSDSFSVILSFCVFYMYIHNGCPISLHPAKPRASIQNHWKKVTLLFFCLLWKKWVGSRARVRNNQSIGLTARVLFPSGFQFLKCALLRFLSLSQSLSLSRWTWHCYTWRNMQSRLFRPFFLPFGSKRQFLWFFLTKKVETAQAPPRWYCFNGLLWFYFSPKKPLRNRTDQFGQLDAANDFFNLFLLSLTHTCWIRPWPCLCVCVLPNFLIMHNFHFLSAHAGNYGDRYVSRLSLSLRFSHAKNIKWVTWPSHDSSQNESCHSVNCRE